MIAVLITAMTAVLFCSSNGAPVAHHNASNFQDCTFTASSPSSLEDFKTISCMMEKEILELLKDAAIPTMESQEEREECNCQELTERFKYTPTPSYNVAPHIRIQHQYKSHQSYRFPENTVDLEGNSVPVTTEWILHDYVDSLKGFVGYFTASSLSGPQLDKAVWELNATVLSLVNSFPFSSDCQSNIRTANFTSLKNDSCELKCATWLFNDTLKGFNNALVNQEIYKSKTSYNTLPGIVPWSGLQCCPLLEQAHSMTAQEYRTLTCNVQSLYYNAHTLFQQLGQQATTECDGINTVTGVKTWKGYYGNGDSFPPIESSCSYNDKLYIYGNHFNGLEKYNSDLSLLMEDTTYECFSPLAKATMQSIKDTLEDSLPMATHWMKAHGCPSCADSCTVPDGNQATPTQGAGLQIHQACPDMYRQLSCLANDMKSVATSLYLFLELRDEATPTWDYQCPTHS